MPNAYAPGNTIRLTATIIASGGAPMQPASGPWINIMLPTGSVASNHYSGGGVTRIATGAYYVDYVATVKGNYTYRVYGGGNIQVADEQAFAVYASPFL